MIYLALLLLVPIDMYVNVLPVWIAFVAAYIFWVAYCLRKVGRP
jgi:hypothetical protein